MKTVFKLSFLALGLVTVALPSLQAAQDDTGRQDRHPRLRALFKHRAAVRAKVARRLDLSSDQIARLKSGRATTVEALKAIRRDPSLTKEQKRAKARETLQAARAEFRSVLTPEQQAKIDRFRARRAERQAGRL